MNEQEKTRKMEQDFQYHKDMAKKIKKDLRDQKKPFESSYRDGYIKTMKFCTQPFASYNKNLNSYLSDSILFKFNKLLKKVSYFNEKIETLDIKELKMSKINKLLAKINKLKSNLDEYLDYNPELSNKNKETKTVVKNLRINKKKLNDQKAILNVEIVNKSGTIIESDELTKQKDILKDIVNMFE